MSIVILIGFLLCIYVGASIIRTIKGYSPPPEPKSKKFNTIKERIQ